MKLINFPLETMDPELLYQHQGGPATPPVDVWALAEKMGLKVDTSFSFEQLGYSGEIYWDDEAPTVWINTTESPVRQRFTLAHEIGHYILHMLPDFDRKTEFKDKASALRRGGGWDYREMQANRFAASLLMPKALIHEEIQKLNGVPSKSALAKTFDVSQESMGFRLSKLGYTAQP